MCILCVFMCAAIGVIINDDDDDYNSQKSKEDKSTTFHCTEYIHYKWLKAKAKATILCPRGVSVSSRSRTVLEDPRSLLPSHRASALFGRYQIILLGVGGIFDLHGLVQLVGFALHVLVGLTCTTFCTTNPQLIGVWTLFVTPDWANACEKLPTVAMRGMTIAGCVCAALLSTTR